MARRWGSARISSAVVTASTAEPADTVGTAEPVVVHEPGRAEGPPPGTLTGDEVATGSGRLRLLTVQPEGKPAMAAEAWRHGAHPGSTDRLGA